MDPAPSAPRDLAQRVWGSWPSLPAGAAPAAAPERQSAPAAAPLEPDVAELDIDEEQFDADLLRLEDRLRDTEDRLTSFAESMQQALRTLGDTIRASTAELPGVVDRVVERRLNAVGDALLKLADLRAKLQEETAEAVKGMQASFQALEERLAETTQERVQASIERLVSEVREVREDVARTTGSTAGEGRVLEAIEHRLRDRVAELPTRGDFASIRGAIGTVASSLRGELAEAIERIGRIEQTLAGMASPAPERRADEAQEAAEPEAGPPPSQERSVDDPFDGRPLFDFPER
ncbi:MAG TPA: hypothetical protein VG709_04090 [Actinomycetota bacterium]|nr:hypothetical protein [Actinomycetota bacterium]